MDVQVYVCAGRCGKEVLANPDGTCSWNRLEILGKYRCWDCERLLSRMSSIEGAPAKNDIDKLPKDSIGSLKQLPERRKLHEKPG